MEAQKFIDQDFYKYSSPDGLSVNESVRIRVGCAVGYFSTGLLPSGRNACQTVETSPALLSRVFAHACFPSAGAAFLRRRDDRTASTEAAADARKVMVLARRASAWTSSAIVCHS